MPTYDYQCQSKKCGKKFTVFLSLSDYEKGKVACPKCKSKRVKQLPAIFIANTSRKS
ncbi:MAG: zinc ribbon domain-containing protein [Deltaproteobacteria bacterium]|jgi:putative FmdB family regulatory protein|nr:zinc ribbon domain-containing protein [Deltaproteobacteria bacterium]MBN2687253.1 zinc ribbon domain-containing protein [Deltaproteobacteria bacterium]